MNNDPLEQFRAKISSYSADQLEEVLISLNKDKFPEKYQWVREALAHKKREAFFSSENMQSTEVIFKTVTESQSAFSLSQTSPATETPITSSLPPSPTSLDASKNLSSQSSGTDGGIGPETQSNQANQGAAPQVDLKEKPRESVLQRFLLFLVIVTSIAAIYCSLLPTMPLPGKSFVLKIAQTIPKFSPQK
jgi:hypothetical protein